MKTIITFTFLLFSLCGFSQTTREEVITRNKEGQKLIVLTYSGTGNGEKLIKKTEYYDDNGTRELHRSYVGYPVSLKPASIEYYGKYKEIVTYTSVMESSSYKVGDSYEYLSYGRVKKEIFYGDGTLKETWKIEDYDESGSNGHAIERVKVHYVVIP